ncbi:CbtB-domain containing protein [Kitasatospora sp. NPDC004745]|uniref:CbtB domain-containing protein n=1 Tax=unclassified Kitasatospora TaxID=2633591 RepID=UPI0033DCF1B3
MASSVASPISSPEEGGLATIPVRAVLPWAVFFGVLMLLAIYFVGAEQGATSLISGEDVHEWVHDGRHLLGFPCH